MLYGNEQVETLSTEDYFYLTENFEFVDSKTTKKLVRYLVYNKKQRLMDTVRVVMQEELTEKERDIAVDYWEHKMSVDSMAAKYHMSRSAFYRAVDVIRKKLETSLKYVIFYNDALKPPSREDFLTQIGKAVSMGEQIEN